MSDVAVLVAPSVRWHDEYGYDLAEREAVTALSLGCRGVLLHGGPLDATKALLVRLRELAPHALFAAAELGGGVGERFPGATALPPLAALDATDLEAIRRAARLTAREARAAGINWALGPTCVLPERAPPIEAARTFRGGDGDAGAACAEWLDACQAEGVVAAPGPYPDMRSSAADAALDAGAGAILLAPSHATDREAIAYLRERAGFDGIIAAPFDTLPNARDEDEEPLAVACVAAGCDLLLGVDDIAAVVTALRRAHATGAFDAERMRASNARIAQRVAWADVSAKAAASAARRDPTLDDVLWARRAADAAVHIQRGRAHTLVPPVDVIIVDDDPRRIEPAGTGLRETLSALDIEIRHVESPTPESRGSVIVALFGDHRIALGFDTYSDGALARVRDCCSRADRSARDSVVVHFTPPDFVRSLEGLVRVACAWSGTRAMEEAAARWLARGETWKR